MLPWCTVPAWINRWLNFPWFRHAGSAAALAGAGRPVGVALSCACAFLLAFLALFLAFLALSCAFLALSCALAFALAVSVSLAVFLAFTGLPVAFTGLAFAFLAFSFLAFPAVGVGLGVVFAFAFAFVGLAVSFTGRQLQLFGNPLGHLQGVPAICAIVDPPTGFFEYRAQSISQGD